jgi:hypothetical protein
VLFDAGVNLTVSALEAAYLPALSSLAAIPKGMINGATKKTIGTLIRTPAVVNASYKESPENIIPTSAEVVSGLKGLVHGAAMDITYNNAMANVLMLGETVMGGHASPVADAILHNINPIGELDPLLGQYTLDGYNADSVVNEPNETRSRSEWTFDRVVNTNRIARNAAARWKNTITSSV